MCSASRLPDSPVEGLHGLAVRLEALMTEIEDDDVVLDTTTMRRLRAFGHALQGLVKIGR